MIPCHRRDRFATMTAGGAHRPGKRRARRHLLSDSTTLHRNPQRDASAKLCAVSRIRRQWRWPIADRPRHGLGRMNSKIEAARIATAPASLCDRRRTVDHPLTRFAATGRGTVFTAQKGGSARKPGSPAG